MENTTQNSQITVTDLDSIRTIIDIAAQRGAFKAGEMAQVGTVFNKLTAFLEAVVAEAKAQAGETADSTDTTESTTSTDNAETQGE